MTRIALALGVVLLAGLLVFIAQAPAPQAAAGSFYAEYLKLRPSGIPGADGIARLEPFLSARLNALLRDGDRAELRYKEATKNEVPPLIEGDVFTSLFEGATVYAVRDCAGDDAQTICPVSLTYRRRGEPETKWTDSVALVREQSGWRVDDVIYGGDWPFAKHGRLTEMLKSTIAESQKPIN